MHLRSEFATLFVLVSVALFANVLVQSSPAPDNSYELQWRSRREAAAEPEAEPESSSASSEPEPESSSAATAESEPTSGNSTDSKKKGFFEKVGDNIKKAGENVKQGANQAMEKVKSAAETAKDSVKKGINNVATKVKAATEADPTTSKPCNTTDVNCTMQDVKNKAEGMMEDMSGNSSSTEPSSEKKSKRASGDDKGNSSEGNNDNQSGKSGQNGDSGQSGQNGDSGQSGESSTETSTRNSATSSVSSSLVVNKPAESQNRSETDTATSLPTKFTSNTKSQIGNDTDSEETKLSSTRVLKSQAGNDTDSEETKLSSTRVIKSQAGNKETETEATPPSTKVSKRTKNRNMESDDNEPILQSVPNDVINSDDTVLLKEKNVTIRDTTIPTLPPLGPNPSLKKPGKCPKLAPGLSCVALSNDAAQCRSDSACQGTKKCCFFACEPYRGVGVCETPDYYSSGSQFRP